MFNEGFSREEFPEEDEQELNQEEQEQEEQKEEEEEQEEEKKEEQEEENSQENSQENKKEEIEKEMEFASEFVNKESDALEIDLEKNEKEPPKGIKHKVKKAIIALTLGLSLIAPVNAYANEANLGAEQTKAKSQATEIEHQEHGFSAEQESKLALKTIEELKNIPDQGVKNKAMNDYYKKIVAKTIINRFALELKLGKTGDIEGQINAKDISAALKVLEKNVNKFIDQEYGNKDGKVDIKEWNEFSKDMSNYPGIQEMEQMILDYSTMTPPANQYKPYKP